MWFCHLIMVSFEVLEHAIKFGHTILLELLLSERGNEPVHLSFSVASYLDGGRQSRTKYLKIGVQGEAY